MENKDDFENKEIKRIIEKVISLSKENKRLTLKEIKSILNEELKNYPTNNNLEDWQVHYSKEKIMNGVLTSKLLLESGIKKSSLFGFKGRINRLNHFYIFLSVIFILAIVNNFVILTFDSLFNNSTFGSLFGITIIFVVNITGFWVYFCSIIKRFHDLNKSGNNFWFLLVPLYNIYIYACLFFQKGTAGVNEYGAEITTIN